MPTPREGESRDGFISRCIPKVKQEGLRGKKPSQDQAIAACMSMWRGKKEINNSFTIWKERGQYKWFAIWSNKYRDRDIPPEIITNDAHLDFVKAVNSGEWPYPELQIWHIEGSAFGDATYIDYDEVNGFSLAGGTIRKGMDVVVEALNSAPTEILVSHGFPMTETRRDDPDDPTIITRFRSKEISPLPDFAAANEGTGFVILGGNSMSEVKPTLKERLSGFLGIDKGEEVAEHLDLMGNEAKEAGLEFKDDEVVTDDVVVGDDAVVDPVTEPDGDTEAKEVEVEAEADEDKEAPITREEIADAMEAASSAVLKEIVESIVNPLQAEIKSLTDMIESQNERIEVLSADEEKKIAEAAAWTSAPSITDIMKARAIGKSETEVDGRKSLARSGPKETQPQNTIVNTGVPVLNSALSNIVDGNVGGAARE